MKKGVLFALIFLSVFSFSQQKNVKITNLQPQSEDFIFPLISYSQKAVVQQKINTFLQVDELEFVPNSGKNPYQLASTATNSYQNYLYFYSWKRLGTPRNILSLEMEGEASGAYPEGFTNYRNFDLRTGNFINLEDLFQPNSYFKIEKIINDKIKKRVKDYIIELKAAPTRDQDKDDQIAMYQDCFTENTLPYLKFYFGRNQFTIVAGRCSNHALRALDDLGSHEIVFKYKELEKYFSPFAKNLLSDSEKVISPGSIQNKLYKGKIDGKYPIMLLVKQIYDDNSFTCVYWYVKNKKLIEWHGTFKNNHISATEDDYHDENLKEWIPRAKIEAHLKGTKIVGTWQDYKTKKNLNLELEEL
ncbi:hypothetical protein [Kaistella jeonii]|uniref:Uncharacterized protein n=1 Tax=Kaistella jeonii TaxID=266749 RepID=A0A0C1F1X7_9FLAO|nr:hypothetical protein [Kaistella jeonii]KIA85968.1 hypothetical protein OA86_14200 [Kaistella jeonii]SFC38516.1 hypothetical protein SAMN05421876_11738 [Kaistella jeonii]VEI96849.1 Protein of uncharacterised function (DUF3298) [Kaistella jeonii]